MATASATKIDNRPNDLLDIRPVQPLIGAEIHGIDISKPLDPATRDAIRAAVVKHKVVFFRDQQLRLYRKFSDQLTEKLASSAVLICIPSPNYVESDWCLWELEQFHKRTGGDRIIKVVKTHFDEQSLTPSSKSLLKQIEPVLDCPLAPYPSDCRSGVN